MNRIQFTNKDENYLKKELYEKIKTDDSVFDFIQDGSLDGLWYWDLENLENEWMNRKFWTTLGYDPDVMPHKSDAWQNIIHPEDLKVATENFIRHCENPEHPYDQIVRYFHKNGSTVWIRCRGLAIRDSNGKAIRMLGAHQDI
ncbi:MAG: PAS domain-containing protein, partial [Bacteroidota bacterium]